MTEAKIKYLELIQNVISRMNANSFKIKGWMITVLSALLALYANGKNDLYIYLAIVPILLFWILDADYLQQERKYRKLYEDIISEESNVQLFKMSTENYANITFVKVLFSKTLLWLYGCVVLLYLLYFLFSKCCVSFSFSINC